MKRNLYFAVLTTLLTFLSCSKTENLTTVQEGSTLFTFKLETPELKSRSTETTIRYVMQVLDTYGNQVGSVLKNTGGQFNVSLEMDETYTLLFWADEDDLSSSAIYNVADLKNVTLLSDHAGVAYCLKTLYITGVSNQTNFTLNHAVAQVNLLENKQIPSGTNELKVNYQAYTAFGVHEALGVLGSTEGREKTISLADAIDGRTSPAPIGMFYVLSPLTEAAVSNIEFQMNDFSTQLASNVPLRANYRTNITGNFFNQSATPTFSVTIDQDWASDDNSLDMTIAVAPRLVVVGTGDDAKLELTRVISYDAAFFKFGNVIAFSRESEAPIYNPSNRNTHINDGANTNLPDYADASSIHTLEGLQDGKGDPCRLVGYTVGYIKEELSNGNVPDNRTWRMPTKAEYESWIATNSISSGYYENNRVKGHFFGSGAATGQQTGEFLPALGYRHQYSSFTNNDENSLYWSSSCETYGSASVLQFDSESASMQPIGHDSTLPIRCVRY